MLKIFISKKSISFHVVLSRNFYIFQYNFHSNKEKTIPQMLEQAKYNKIVNKRWIIVDYRQQINKLHLLSCLHSKYKPTRALKDLNNEKLQYFFLICDFFKLYINTGGKVRNISINILIQIACFQYWVILNIQGKIFFCKLTYTPISGSYTTHCIYFFHGVNSQALQGLKFYIAS